MHKNLQINKRLKAFEKLGSIIEDFLSGKNENDDRAKFLNKKIIESESLNPWFNRENILHSLSGISYMLKPEKLSEWLKKYKELDSPEKTKNIAVIMAGNIPLVNFHDFLCVLISGHSFIGKLSSNDPVLPVSIGELLIELEPGFKDKVHFTQERLSDFDAIIATGSDNTSRYFEYYFGKYPHIIRKNRNSLAILDGNEDKESLKALSQDIFRYYGLGCRNVSALLVPEGYKFNRFFESLEYWKDILDFYKYKNNYDYYKALFLVNKTPHLDNGFVLLKKDISLASPLAVIHYQSYKTKEDIKTFISKNQDSIQCIVGLDYTGYEFQPVPFGKSQFPGLSDYPDRIDTMEFLLSIS